jgi:predicted N-formylglutamate amidohydrolase
MTPSEPPFEIVGDVAAPGPFFFICEHATRLLPEWEPEPADLPILEDHWGWDIGAADLTRALVTLTRSSGVLSRFSRLICDPNRDPDEPSFVVERVDGHTLSFNRRVDARERQRRRERYFDPYHDAIDRALRARRSLDAAVQLCSIHSFTPIYLGRDRPMEIGVLFDRFDEVAWRLEGALAEQGFEVALNAPYSARDGLIYAAQRHGAAHDLVYLELEVRQDLIATPGAAQTVARRIARALAAVAPPADGCAAP